MTASPPSRQQFIQDALGLSVEEFLDGIREWRTYGPHRTAKRLDAANVAAQTFTSSSLKYEVGRPGRSRHVT